MNVTIDPAQIHSPMYSTKLYHPVTLKKLVERTAEVLAEYSGEHWFGALAVSGSSGLILAGAVSAVLQVPLIMVRREHEQSHGDKVQGVTGMDYVIVDDLISSGATATRIINSIQHQNEQYGEKAQCVGVYLYTDPETRYGRRRFFQYRTTACPKIGPEDRGREPWDVGVQQ